MTLIQGLLIFFSILSAYFIIIYILKLKGLFEKFNLSMFGPFLMIRTKKGRNLLKKIAKRERFWKAYGTWGIIICVSLMIIFTLFFVYSNFSFILFSTPQERAALPGPEIALVYPGINPALPIETIGYFIIAFIVAVVVHEFSHGILAIVGKMKVKSLGLLFMIVPVGAFCEPDEEELKKADPVKRMRVFAAGPLSNFTVAMVIIITLTCVFMPAVSHVQGVDIFYSLDNSPGEEIGLSAGCVITSINDTSVSDLYVFREVMDETYPNQTINITYFRKGEYIKKEVKLTSVYQYDTSNETYKNISFLGIGFNPYIHFFDYVKNPFLNDFPFSFLGLTLLPLSSYILGYNPIAEPYTHAYQLEGPLSAISPDIFWIIFTILFWIFWLNFLLGLFNILPMIPLDGGYLFKDAFSLFLKKISKNITDEKTEKISKNVAFVVSLIILFAIVSQFFLKYIP
jgi:membrane-associated protease RseP (regulator of RpoE activity)